MLFSILGPVEVRGDRGPCEPASPMSRQVLSLLLVHANQVVPLESLVEELWDDTPPKLARKTVQTYIYHVRKALREGAGGGPWVQTESRGYRLRVGAGQLDLWRFQELCARGRAALSEGRPGPASDAFREALALCGGRPSRARPPVRCSRPSRPGSKISGWRPWSSGSRPTWSWGSTANCSVS
nr:winged helix-turn-helix domain-containing protein [Streptomyces sp. W007]